MNAETNHVERVIGFDSHPDTFTATILRGPTPAAAVVEKTFNKLSLRELETWAQKQTTAQDLFVLEASGNSFHVVRILAKVNRRARVLESCHLGKLKEAHANNDKISAVRIGKAYLAGTAKEVWVPDLRTQERRDWFHAHRKAGKRTTQIRNRLLSYLSDNGVRLKKHSPLSQEKKARSCSSMLILGPTSSGRCWKSCWPTCATPTSTAENGAVSSLRKCSTILSCWPSPACAEFVK